MATDSVTANSRNSRPTMPPINRMGMNTATSDTLIERTVKPISCAPCSAACSGFMPSSRWRLMFSITTIASSTTKPVAMVSAISDKIVEAVAAQVHHAERADERHGHGDAGDEGRAHVSQEQEHDQDHQADRDQRASTARRATDARIVVVRSMATSTDRCRRESRPSTAAAGPSMRSTVSMMLAPGCRKMMSMHRGLAVGQARWHGCPRPSR